MRKKKLSTHDFIIQSLLAFTPKIIEVSAEEFCDCFEDVVDYKQREIPIQICREKISWGKEIVDFGSRCYVDIEGIVYGLDINGKIIDSYGSVLIKDELLLNNCGACFYEENKFEKGFCNVLGFITINKKGVVRFTQIVYSFFFKKLVVREDFSIQLPFKVNLKKDFGGKRAVYYDGITLSLRTTLDIYKKVDKKYWQSDECKNDLSYPRLLLKTTVI